MIDDSRYRNLLAKLAIKDQRWERQGCERLLVQFESRRRRKIKKDLQRQIEAAERDNDVDLLSKLLKQKQLHAGKK
jgi:DNA primase